MTEARIAVSPRTKWLTGAGVAAIHLAALAALIAAFGVDAVVGTVRSIAAFDIRAPAPPPEPEKQVEEPRGEAAPPAPKATPKPERVEPPPVVTKPKPQPVATATGTSQRSGAREAGPGSGAGGQGAGTGAGGSGSGAGGGLSRGVEKVSGELRTRDFPRSGAGERDGRFIIVRYTVGVDGRVGNCRVVQSSGSAEADAITCRLIERRFRYRPALDAQGNPVARETGWKQWWWRPA
ncbi:MAG: energy transducer TonB [Novosphingobium sp.]|nr:energy transducer TonB [Novosphingobium sp.]